MIKRLLYLTYISVENVPTSGSSVRPLKMKEAFEGTDVDVITFGGMNNNIKLRKKVVKEIREKLKTWKPDACYIEPPSGPLFYYGDVRLIKYLHKQGIKTSIFYRDAYWKYPDFSEESGHSLTEKLKRFFIKQMQVFQWNVFKKNIDLIYFPSMTMAKEFDCPRKNALPPGGFVPDATEKTVVSKPVQFIFVGGAAKNYGTYLTIEAFDKLNNTGIKAKLIYICPENQWNRLGIDKEKRSDWLEVVHTSGDSNLKKYYEQADAALLTAPHTFYRDFAVPIKIFEYMSYLKPVLVTDCTETAKIVRENQMGWICKDDADSVAKQLADICDCPEEIFKIRNKMKQARNENLWQKRAERVIRELEQLEA